MTDLADKIKSAIIIGPDDSVVFTLTGDIDAEDARRLKDTAEDTLGVPVLVVVASTCTAITTSSIAPALLPPHVT